MRLHITTNNFCRRTVAVAAGLALMSFGVAALADPPARVARLGYISGAVSFAPAGDDEWGRAAINRPLGAGDRLWADSDGRAEVQVGGAMLRLSANTAVSVLNLDDDIAQLQLTEGSLNVRVRRLDQGQTVEVDTPNLAFTLREPGVYRIDVDAEGKGTTIRMREGRGEVTGENASYLLDAPQVQRFVGEAQRDDAYASAPPPDDFDRWAVQRDTAFQTSVSARYVSPDVVGYEDLDDNGNWSAEASYGNVWYPSRVAVGWAPYRDGHWAWVDPWGWTWVDDARWGYAVSHYGRWANIRGRWGWVPGPPRVKAYYAPALVAFVGGPNFRLSISTGGVTGVAWFPLGPREVYRPAYKVSPAYFERVNVSNTVVNTTVVNNVYINKNVTNITYVNRRVPGAVVAVPTTAFTQSQSVAKVVVKAPKEVVEGKVVVVAGGAPVAPTEKSVRGGNEAGGKPPPRAFARAVVARTQPPPPAPSFASQQQRLAAKPGQPLDDDERKQLRASAPAPVAASGSGAATAAAAAPAVKVVAAGKAGKPQSLPAQSAKASEARVAAAEPSASKPEAERQAAAKDKPDRAASAADRQHAAASGAEGRQAAASAAREGRDKVAERGRNKPASGAAGRAGSEGEALDAVAEAEKRAPPAAGSTNKPSAEERKAAREAARPQGEAASAARAPRPDSAASARAGQGGAPAMSREERQAARAAARGERGASAPSPRTRPGDASRPPAEASRPRPNAPGEQPPATARAPHPAASAASHPKGKQRDEAGNAPS